MTTAAHLNSYRPLLAADGLLALRTDSLPLYEFSLPQFQVDRLAHHVRHA